jgi:Dyp-type peroxidase family
MVHTVFNVVTPVAKDNVDDVRALLGEGPDNTFPLPVETLPTLHFASLVVFDAQKLPDGRMSMAYLVLQCCIDGPVKEFLDALVFLDGQHGNPVEKIYDLCHNRGKTPLRTYLAEREHLRYPHLLHIGVPGMRLSHIHAGKCLRASLDTELDTIVAAGGSNDDPMALVEELRTRLRVPAMADVHCHFMDGQWVEDPTKRWLSRLWHWSKLALFAAIVAVILVGPLVVAWRWGATLRWSIGAVIGVVLIGFAIFKILTKWYFGANNAPIELRPGHLERLKHLEDRRRVLNHMCTFTIMQDSAARRVANRIALGVLNLIYRTWFTDVTPGRLDGLPTIHFAHWTQVPVADSDGNRTHHKALMFLSNYDGSWEAYLDDFIASLANGVATIWASCVGFRWPMHGPTFKAFARNGMTPWRVWYTGEPDMTVLNIHNNDQIRKGLVTRPRSPEAARLWLSRFGSLKEGHEFIPEPTGNLQVGDVQGLVLSGYAHLRWSSHVPLRIDNPAAAKQWLQSQLKKITDGRHIDKSQRGPRAVNLALTFSGLEKLGLPAGARHAFPIVFREGMAPRPDAHRSRALGDTCESAPQHWNWGAEGSRRGCVDALLFLYANSKDELRAVKRECVTPFLTGQCGEIVAAPIQGEMMTSAGKGPLAKFPAEHFGFVDGISQPQIEGTWHRTKSQPVPENDILRSGEFVLGYPDEAGLIAAHIPIDRADDPLGMLPQLNGGAACRDFGRNGSFLVARQLHQDVARFRAETVVWGGAHGPHELAARMVGRTRDGLPLADTVSPDAANDFTYVGDPHGFKCPVGAHIRRANPRGSLGHDFDASLVATRRRRLLRRGRTYGKPLRPNATADDGRARGVMFICLNADIERQFEFVQQNWINNTVFSGVYSETDPGVGDRNAEVGLTIQAEGVRDRVLNLSRFVTVKGGGYFFLPGMRALRYIASCPLPAESAAPITEGPAISRTQTVPAPVKPSAASAVVQRVAAILPIMTRLVLLRFQILTAIGLLLFGALGAGSENRIGPSLYVAAHWGGVVLVALVASLAAWIVMLGTRLPLMYGHRFGVSPARWQGPLRWPAVLLFQTLALPVVLATLHWTAVDAAGGIGAQPNTREYLAAFGRLALAALAGFGLAWLLLALTSTITRFGFVVRLTQRVTQWALALPKSIGTGYVDYDNRRLLPGHGRLIAMAAVTAALYVTGAIMLSPVWAWSRSLAEHVPSVAFLLTPVLAAGVVLPAIAFFLDRYRVPTLLIGVVALGLLLVVPSGHSFPVGPQLSRGPTPQEALAAARQRHPTRDRVVVVIGEGYGLVSSAWTARVLTSLAENANTGRQFIDSVRLVSTASGASLGALYFLDGYSSSGFAVDRLALIRERAGSASSGEGGWGFAYPDSLRVVLPFVVPSFVDRGWAMERAWRGRLSDPAATLAGWRNDTAAGWRPATAFGATLVETGQHAASTSYDAGDPSPTGGYDIAMVTAARLSATFPFISPPTRPDAPGRVRLPSVVDAGLTDNSGWTAARRWFDAVRGDVMQDRILLLDIRSVPPASATTRAGSASWLDELTAPVSALANARGRDSQQRAEEIEEFVRTWTGAHQIAHVIFRLNERTVPLSWNLGRADAARLDAAWARNRDNALAVCRFVAEDPSPCR